MAAPNSLESFQALYADLVDLSDAKLSDLNRLLLQIESSIPAFTNVLDKRTRNEESRKSLATGKLDVDGEQYAINEEFQAASLRLADDLNIDELDAARLFLDSQNDTSGQPAHTAAIIRFHQRRKSLLDCLRTISEISADIEQEDNVRVLLQEFVRRIVSPPGSTSRYVQKCVSSMGDIKIWLQNLADKVNGASVLGQSQQPDFLETIQFQQTSLVIQHESLGLIVLWLVKLNYSEMADFDLVLDTLKKTDRYDNLLLHYFPVLGAYISCFGGTEGGGTMTEAKNLNDRLFAPNQNPWALPYVQAAFRAWWLAEYSGWYVDINDGSIPENQLEDETTQRSRQFTEALKDGAFDFLLSISADAKPIDWHDPARQGLRQWLQRKTPVMLNGSFQFSKMFQEALMEQLEAFIEAFITNLPDVLRKLRTDEDEQRQLNQEHDHDLDLERFLVIISFSFEKRPKAALEGFWDVRDGALMGFVHWASRRASTPLVTAFCEMLQSISEDEECATAAHEFLLDDGPQSSGKMRRTHSLSWNQIFKELTFFSSKIRNRPALPQPQTYRAGKPPSDFAEAEPESSMMLESYLRLITRLCTESTAVRTFLSQHSSFHMTELLFQLASSAIGPRLRACAFTTLRSFLSHKTRNVGQFLWTTLDIWVSGGYAPGSSAPKATSSGGATSSASAAGAILKGLTSGFEEPTAFVQLLHALVSPYEDDCGLYDSLPFPEQLGISSRMPGIDPYIDYALGEIFGSRVSDLTDIVQQRLLRLSCLDFITTCLDTFNENLVIFASQSNVAVDTAISTSNLENYVLLHPFSRVMEWMFNDKVVTALFAAIHQEVRDVYSAEPDSPLVLSLLRSIHVVTKVLDLQPTYLDIIKPLIKSNSTYRRSPVPNAAFTAFEDGFLSHLNIIPDLGRYCGTGHPELVIASLKLLEKLSASPRLTSGPTSGLSRGVDRNKALAALDDDAEEISKILLREMEVNIDINRGPDCSEYIVKLRILDFLISCLRASPGQPTIAHILLGFKCGDHMVNVDGDGLFSRGISLFHTILESITNWPLSDDSGMCTWLVSLNYRAIQVIKELWSSPISSNVVMAEMRSNDAFFMMFPQETMIQPGMLWDGLEIGDPAFELSPSVSCLSDFMYRRSIVLQYLSSEMRQVMISHTPSLKQRIYETLMGSTRIEDGQMYSHASIFELFDFMEPNFGTLERPSDLSYFQDIDLHSCLDIPDDPDSTSNIDRIEELLILRRAELANSKRVESPQDLLIVNQQAEMLLKFFAVDNQIKSIRAARLKVLRAWVQLMLLLVGGGDFEKTSKTSIMLRTLQTIMPRLESDLQNVPEATELAKLAKVVIFSLDFDPESFKKGDMGDLVNDRLFHLFHVSLKAINSLGSKTSLKEAFYNISYRYLTGMSDITSHPGIHRRHSIQTIKSAGERLIDVVCDDAYASEPTCRIAALLLLGALVNMGKHENSKYIIESLTRLNFITILVASIQNIATDLRDTEMEHVDLQLSYCNAKLALLLQIAQTRFGAATVLNAGLFHAIKESGLFVVDPDLGVDIEGPDVVSKHYSLLAAIMRVVCAALLSRGAQNEQSLEQGRRFLTENRLPILAVLKKSAGLVAGVVVSEQVEDLAESFILLVTFTGFLEFEEKVVPKKSSLTAFT
ncbi:Nucleoporin [Lachnellula hyalina]|uniref:Nucleoporin n=1 Tax=Lachnellula hyalina TaxID=1316788 RepID=A0A8H8TWI2_9HELO|nr:Nucleoporin [Lachnellula hyalina]TVY24924.1 Nucleoporin [Lachnellula hyalina]